LICGASKRGDETRQGDKSRIGEEKEVREFGTEREGSKGETVCPLKPFCVYTKEGEY